MSDDYDTPWKDALQRYFPEFMAFYFPRVYSEIDWTTPFNFLDQELAQVTRDAELGFRRVDTLVTVAHLLTQQTRNQPVKRFEVKWTLARLLYARQWDRQRIIDLFSVIDWMMAIPPPLQDALLDNIKELEKSAAMPYMNPFEKRGLERGGRAVARAILTLQLEKRFGNLSRESVDTLERAETEQLMRWSTAVLDAPSIKDVFSSR